MYSLKNDIFLLLSSKCNVILLLLNYYNILFDANFVWNYIYMHQSMLIILTKCNCDNFFFYLKCMCNIEECLSQIIRNYAS